MRTAKKRTPGSATGSIAALADRDGGRSFSRSINGGSITNCGRSFVSITHLLQTCVPAFQIAAVRGLLCAGNGNITNVVHREESAFAWQREWRGPIRR